MRRALVDASVFITLAEIGLWNLLHEIDGNVVIPAIVQGEINDEPAAGILEQSATQDPRWIGTCSDPSAEAAKEAAWHLGEESLEGGYQGDVALLAHALEAEDPLIVTDDKPLRKTCKALGIPVTGSIGVIIGAVERNDLDSESAMNALEAMDEVGARLSARLLRRAGRLIEDAAGEDREP